MPKRILEDKLELMLAEDLGQGDVTTAIVVPAGTTAEAAIVSKEQGIVAGIEEANVLLKSLGISAEATVRDGEKISPGKPLMKISGDASTILSVERTLLNILSRMSGIATATMKLVEALQHGHFKTRIACTRKTAPGLLYFDKKAVWLGGGDTHRLHLDDMILIKDNHIAVVGDVGKAVRKVREHCSFSKKIEVEVTKVKDALDAAEAGADIIMLDNFSVDQVKDAVALLRRRKLRGKVLLEASGGIKGDQVLVFAQAGVDFVSLGELTHSSRALNISLEFTRICKDRKKKIVSRT